MAYPTRRSDVVLCLPIGRGNVLRHWMWYVHV